MKIRHILTLVPLTLGVAFAQMPDSFDASGKSAQSQNGVNNNDPTRAGEPANPQLFGMELPLLDPSNDTMSYNGAKFDVGNNKVVRERFEKYLNSTPDDSAESKRYRKRLNEILDTTNRYTRKKTVGSPILVKIGKGLLEIGDYTGDGGQATALASAMVSALDAQRANEGRTKQNDQMDKEISKLITDVNRRTNRNTGNPGGGGGGKVGSINGKSGGSPTRVYDGVKIAQGTKEVAAREAAKVKNEATNEANLLAAKTSYQSLIATFLVERRFDHAVIGSRVYRHLFRDGDTKLNMDKNSDAYKMITGIGGMPPTVNLMDTMASNARRDVDQAIDAVNNLLAQNKMGEATDRLITAVAIGEFMQSVQTFPTESRRRIAHYWTLRKRGLTALNARDFDTAETVAAEMKALDADFDDSLLRTFCSGKKRLSNLHLRNAMKALKSGNDELFNKEITEAGVIWPLNPNLDEGEKKLAALDNNDQVLDEFRALYGRKDYRAIYADRQKFKVVALDPQLEEQYTKALEYVGTVEKMIQALDEFPRRDRTIGPCIAYEQLLQFLKENEDYANDPELVKAKHRMEQDAHSFVKALDDAKECEERREYGSALSNYYRAQCIYPGSRICKEGTERVSKIIVTAKY